MATIETNKKSSEITQITDIKDASKFDLSWAEKALEQKEIWWKKWKEEAMQHIKKWEARAVASYLDNYQWLDNEVAIALVNNWEIWVVKNNLKKFAPLKEDLQIIFIKKQLERVVAENVKLFDLSPNETAHNIIKYWKKDYALAMVSGYIKNFYELDDTIAYKILSNKVIEWNKFEFIAKNLKYFNNLSKETAKTLIQKWYINEVWNNINHFNKSDLSYIAKNLIEKWGIKTVIENINQFEGVDQVELIKTYIDLGEDIGILYENGHKFNKEWKEYLKNYIVEWKYLKDTDWTRKSFKWLDSHEYMEKMSETKMLNEIKEHWPKVNYREWNKNFLFTTTAKYPTYFSWVTDFGLPLTIHHLNWKILDIKINDLDIEFKNLKDAFYVTGLISYAAKRIKEHPEYKKCFVDMHYNLKLTNSDYINSGYIYRSWDNKFVDKNRNKIADYINNKWGTKK